MFTTIRSAPRTEHTPARARAFASSKAADSTKATEATNPVIVGLLVDHRSASLVAARRAVDMANALGARVDVLVAVPKGTSNKHPALVLSHLCQLVEALRPRHGFSIDVYHGPLNKAAEVLTGTYRPMLVVVDPAIGAAAVTSLVEEIEIPVLVARDARDGEVVAATDMRSGTFPVLSLARRYATAMGRKISYIHNARPLPVVTSDPMAGPTTYVGMLDLQDEVAAAKSARLRAFAADPKSAHLARTGSTVDVILDHARFRKADMVVVGHRARPWWKRLLHTGVANAIVERSRRSVLVTPLADASRQST